MHTFLESLSDRIINTKAKIFYCPEEFGTLFAILNYKGLQELDKGYQAVGHTRL